MPLFSMCSSIDSSVLDGSGASLSFYIAIKHENNNKTTSLLKTLVLLNKYSSILFLVLEHTTQNKILNYSSQ